MKGSIIKIRCTGSCQGLTKHDIIEEISKDKGFYNSEDYDPDEVPSTVYIEEVLLYQILECRGCENISFRKSIINNGDENNIEIFPKLEINSIEIRDFGNRIPRKIKNLYEEVIKVFNSSLNVLCAIGIRGVIEGICITNSIDGGHVVELNKGTGQPKIDENGVHKLKYSTNLEGKIEGLAEKGLITKQHTNMLHKLRFLGNQAAHQLETPSSEHIKLAIDIIENLLTNIYTIETKASQLRLVSDENEISENE